MSACRLRLTRLALTLSVVVLFLPLPAAGEDLAEALRDGRKGDYQKQSLTSLDFILTVGLERSQARAILPLFVEACRLHNDHYRSLAEIQPREIEAYAAFLSEDRLNQGFSPEVERDTARIHGAAKNARETLAVDLNELALGAWEVLTPRQQRITESYKPGTKAVFATFADEKQKRNAARTKARRSRRGPPPRRGDDARLKAAKKDLQELNAHRHPRPDVMAKHLLTPAAAQWLYELARMYPPREVVTAVNCSQYGTPEYPIARCRADRQRVRSLSSEINHWNLVNGMYFSMDQIRELVFLADKAECFKSAQCSKRPREKLAPQAYDAHLVRLELAAESVLRPAQIQVMEEYQPCLIPPKNLKNPVRVGQANDNSRLAHWLERVRGWDEPRIARAIERMIEHEVDRNGPMDDAVKNERRKLLRGVIRRAAGMDDVEFALNKDDLVASITPEDRKQTLTTSIDDMHRQRDKPGRTSQFLLKKDFASVLQLRYHQLASATPPDSDEAPQPWQPASAARCAACHNRP